MIYNFFTFFFSIITLNLNKEISTLCYCQGDLKSTKEYLFIGSPASLMCFGK